MIEPTKPETTPPLAASAGSANTPVMLATMIGALLIKHKVIDGAALDDPDGYDKGHTARGILLMVHDLLDFLEDRIDESPNSPASATTNKEVNHEPC